MLDVLPESRRVRRRASTSAVISGLVHGGVIAAVTLASGAERPHPLPPPDLPIPVVYRPPPDSREAGPPRGARQVPAQCDCSVPDPFLLDELPAAPPAEVPATLPPPDVAVGDPVDWDAEQRLVAVNGRARGAHGAGDPDATLENAYADKPALALEGNPSPRYPELLRAAGVGGSVVMRFVIDTTGRVVPRTAEARHTDHDLFTAAVRAVLPRTRFVPAEANGRKVPVLVEQRFEFRLAP